MSNKNQNGRIVLDSTEDIRLLENNFLIKPDNKMEINISHKQEHQKSLIIYNTPLKDNKSLIR